MCSQSSSKILDRKQAPRDVHRRPIPGLQLAEVVSSLNRNPEQAFCGRENRDHHHHHQWHKFSGTRGQGNIHFPCSANHEQDWQPCPVDPYSAICDDHTYIHTYIHTHIHTYIHTYIQTYKSTNTNINTIVYIPLQNNAEQTFLLIGTIVSWCRGAPEVASFPLPRRPLQGFRKAGAF